MKTGTADLPLHGGKAPAWLFSRMSALAREITLAVVYERGPHEMLRRLSDPTWFQALGCVLGFDWHSSGVTTTVCGALKDGLRGLAADTGLIVAGGKGGVSRKTPSEIEAAAAAGMLAVEPSSLVKASKMAAKVDSAALQDGFQLYHHTFLFTADGSWAVVQQGMHGGRRAARRYHWLSERLGDFTIEPHAAVVSQAPGTDVLNLVASGSGAARSVVTELAGEPPERTVRRLKRLKALSLPRHHEVRLAEIRPENLAKAFTASYERQPKDFSALLATPLLGAKSIRALSLIAELVYDTPASRHDPVLFSFAHGGKDGNPFPIDRATYDASIEVLRGALADARLGRSERMYAFRRLAAFERRAGSAVQRVGSRGVSWRREPS